MQVLKFAGCAGVATGSILVYAYILIYYIKVRGFRGGGYLKEGFIVFDGNRVFLVMVKFVSACVERDKKILKKWIFVRNYLRF